MLHGFIRQSRVRHAAPSLQKKRGFILKTPQAYFSFFLMPVPHHLANLAGKSQWSNDLSLLQLWSWSAVPSWSLCALQEQIHPTQGLEGDFVSLTLGPVAADADPSWGEELMELVEVDWDSVWCCTVLWRLWQHPHRTMGSLGGHQGSFIFGLSNLRMPVLVSMALNFTRLDVSWI